MRTGAPPPPPAHEDIRYTILETGDTGLEGPQVKLVPGTTVEVRLKDGRTRREIVGDNVATFRDTWMAIHRIKPGLRPGDEIRWIRYPHTGEFLLYGPADRLKPRTTVEVTQSNGEKVTERVGELIERLIDLEIPEGMAVAHAVPKGPTREEIAAMILKRDQVRFTRLFSGGLGICGPAKYLQVGKPVAVHRKNGNIRFLRVGRLDDRMGAVSWHSLHWERQ